MAGWRVLVGLWAGVVLSLLDVAAVAASPPSTEQTADAKLFDRQFRPLLVRHCIGCHGGDKPKGKFRLDNLTTDFADAATRGRWTAVIERVTLGEMPPKGKPRPPEADVRALTGWLAPRVAAADTAARAAQGRVILRRLNRVEYENSVRDLLGIHVNLKEQLPEDGSADGFDNAGAANHTSSFLMEK
jgi:mono/diheme cytochrome c family protein